MDDVQLVRELGREAEGRLKKEETERDDPEQHKLLVHALHDLEDMRHVLSVVVERVRDDLEDDRDQNDGHHHHLDVFLYARQRMRSKERGVVNHTI